MQKALDVIFGLVIVNTTTYARIATRKAVKALIGTFNNLVFVETVAPHKVVGETARDYFVPGTTGYIVEGSRFAVKGLCEYGFHAISLDHNDRWLVAKAQGLRVIGR